MQARHLNWKLNYQKRNKEGKLIKEINIPARDVDVNLSCEFNVERSYEATVNKSTIKIYNLSPNTRKALRKEKYETTEFDKISFYAGSSNDLSLIFTGNVLQAESIDAGVVDIATEITALDGSFATYNATSNHNINAGVSYEEVFNRFFKDLQKEAEAVGDVLSLEPFASKTLKMLKNTKTKRPITLYGNTWSEMQKIFGDGLFIDNNRLYYIPITEALNSQAVVLKAGTGLKKVPKVSNAVLEVELMFYPKIKVGSMVEIETTKDNFFSGKQFKVFGVKHFGNISQTTQTQASTTLSLGRFDNKTYYGTL